MSSDLTVDAYKNWQDKPAKRLISPPFRDSAHEALFVLAWVMGATAYGADVDNVEQLKREAKAAHIAFTSKIQELVNV